jgi:hypothetical protein
LQSRCKVDDKDVGHVPVPYPLEFKKTASPSATDTRQFQALAKLKLPVGPGGVICLTERSLPPSQSVLSIPVAAL